MIICSVVLRYEDKWFLKHICLLQPAYEHKKNLKSALWSVQKVNSLCRFSSPPRSLFSRIRTLHNAICLVDESVAWRVAGGRGGPPGAARGCRGPPGAPRLALTGRSSTHCSHAWPPPPDRKTLGVTVTQKTCDGRKWGAERWDPAGRLEFTPTHTTTHTPTHIQAPTWWATSKTFLNMHSIVGKCQWRGPDYPNGPQTNSQTDSTPAMIPKNCSSIGRV